MPFRARVFEDAVVAVLGRPFPQALATSCAAYATAKTPLQKAQCIQGVVVELDREVSAELAGAIMKRCACIGQNTIDRALALQREARDLDDLLAQLNAEHIGGGYLRAEAGGCIVQATYDRCYCGSVSKTRAPLSKTYCACSCGWYARLFEALFGHPVEVELFGSIIQGDEECRFRIHI